MLEYCTPHTVDPDPYTIYNPWGLWNAVINKYVTVGIVICSSHPFKCWPCSLMLNLCDQERDSTVSPEKFRVLNKYTVNLLLHVTKWWQSSDSGVQWDGCGFSRGRQWMLSAAEPEDAILGKVWDIRENLHTSFGVKQEMWRVGRHKRILYSTSR